MRARANSPATARWPFWLLLAAWVCANSPQVAVYTALTWLAEARTFSHQRDLSQQVAHLLVGEKAPSRVAEAVARLELPAREGGPVKAPASIPAATVLKKIDLAAEALVSVVAPEVQGKFCWENENGFGVARRAAPPHGPPRASA
ncbi:MAG: hypothetical protein V4773_04130 [Verrucomicrobiota bacterium]